MLADQEIAYIHLAEADWDDAAVVPELFRKTLRKRFASTIIVAGHYDLTRATQILDAGYADLVAFGRAFIANPDLPRRLEAGVPLSEFQTTTLFGGGMAGYADYPPSQDVSPG